MKTNDVNGRHKQEFQDWVKAKKIKVYDNLSDVSTQVEGMVKGAKVSFTNEAGITFAGLEILGFCDMWYERCVYLDYDCYWIPATLTSLTIE